MKILYVIQGFGEFSQAESFAQYAQSKKDENIFITSEADVLKAIQKAGFTALRSADTTRTHAVIRKIRPDVIFLCNSKTVTMRPESILKDPPPEPRPLIASFDSNWLFLNDKRTPYRAPSWLDLPLVVMPTSIYSEGLREHGGHYQISPLFAKRIFTCGFIPSGFRVSVSERKKMRQQLNIRKGEKLIFTYFGIREPLILPNYLRALDKIIPVLASAGKQVRVFMKLKKEQNITHRPWLITRTWLSSDDYVRFLAAADVVVQHHGLGTLPKVMRNQVPALCIVPALQKKHYPSYEHSPALEIQAFERLGICRVIDYDFEPDALRVVIEELLFDAAAIRKMKRADQTYFQAGETNAYQYLKKTVRTFHAHRS